MTFFSMFDERRLLVTDLDGTLIGGDPEGRQRLQTPLEAVRDIFRLVYVSGQNLYEQLEAIEENQLLLPDYIVSSVGTEIHRLPGEHPVDEWYRYIQGGFEREQIVSLLADTAPHLDFNPRSTSRR